MTVTSAAADVDVPPFTAADVAVRGDQCGRLVLVIPDCVARALHRAGKAGWVEVRDMGDGEGRRYPRGTSVHAAATVLLDVARARLPDDVDIDPETRENTLRAAASGAVAAFVVGRGGWDDAAGWWADYSATIEPHLPGSLHTSFADAPVEPAGRPDPGLPLSDSRPLIGGRGVRTLARSRSRGVRPAHDEEQAVLRSPSIRSSLRDAAHRSRPPGRSPMKPQVSAAPDTQGSGLCNW